MNVLRTLLPMLAVTVWCSLAAAAPMRRAIVVGNNGGLFTEAELRYAEADAQRIAKVLVDLGGFAADEVHTLLGANAERLRALLLQTQGEILAAGGDDASLLFFYYSGHGDDGHLHLSGTRFALRELQSFLDSSSARVRIAVVDACKSGTLTRPKGAWLGPAFEIDVLQDPGVEGKVVITSSSEDEISQESDRIQSSFFTHYWVTGLYGGADADSDGVVTLEEAYRFAHFHTLKKTIASRAGVQHPSFQFDLAGQGNVVLARLNRSTARIEIRGVDAPGTYFLLDADRSLLLTEIIRSEAGAAAIRVPPGKYLVQKREPERLLYKDLRLGAGESVEIEDGDMKVVPYSRRHGSKGHGVATGTGLGGEAPPTNSSGLRVLLGVRTPIVTHMLATPEILIGYRVSDGRFVVEPRFGLRYSEIYGYEEDVRHWEYDFGIYLGYLQPLGDFRLGFGVDGGFVAFSESVIRTHPVEPDPPDPTQPAPAAEASAVQGSFPLGVQLMAVFEAEYALSSNLWLGLSLRGGMAFFEESEASTQSGVFSGLLSWMVGF